MALYTTRSYNEIMGDWEEMQRREMERQQQEAAQRYADAQNKVAINQDKSSGNPLEAVLSGIGNTIGNVGKALGSTLGGAATNNALTVLGDSIINGKSYIQASRDANKRQDDLVKSIYGTDSTKDAYAKNLGTSIDAAATLTDFIPGLGAGTRVALNMGQGVAAGAANPLIEKGSQATLEDAMKGALVGGASAGVGQYVGGKLAGKTAGKGALSKVLNSNVGKGAITGGLAGATGGGLYAGLNGGDVLSGAMQGAQSGALAGGTLAGAMGLMGRGVDKLNNRVNRDMPQAPVDDVTPTTDTTGEYPSVLKRRNVAQTQTDMVEQPEVATATPTRRGIAIVDYDAGEQTVPVRRAVNEYRLGKNQGSNVDGILSPDNVRQLPNAKRPTTSGKTANLADEFAGTDLAKTAQQELAERAANNVKLLDSIDADNDISRGIVDDLNSGKKSRYFEGDPLYEELYGVAQRQGLQPEAFDDDGYLVREQGEIDYSALTPEERAKLFNLANDSEILYSDYEMPQSVPENDISPSQLRLIDQETTALSQPKAIEVTAPRTRRKNIDVSVNTPDLETTYTKRLLQPNGGAADVPVAGAETPRQAARPIRRAADTSNVKVNPNLDPADVARLERQLTVSRQKQGAALLEQYGTLDAPVRRALGSPEDVLTTLYDDYGLKTPADVQYAANHVTGRDGVVSKMTRELASSADNVDTTITRNWLQELMEANGLLDDEQKTVTKQITGALKRANTTSDGATTLDIMKQLEKQSARYKGKDGTYHHATESETRKGIILDLVHDELQDRLWDAAGDPKKVLTPKRLTELKNMYKDNDAWAKFIDNKLAKSTSGAELRSAMKPLVDGAKIVYGSKMSAGGFADRAYKAGSFAHPVVALGQMAYDAALGSDKAKQARASKYAKDAAKAGAELSGEAAPKTSSSKGIGAKLSGVANAINNDTFSNARLGGNVGDAYNMPSFGEIATRQLSRQAGINAMRDQDRQEQIQSGMQEMQDITNEYNNAMQQQQQAQQAYAQSMQQQNAGTGTLERISAGMERALAAGDIDAYSKLADLYQQAYKIYSLQAPAATKSETKALSGNQSKALTGLQQLQTLSGMTPSLSTALANSPVSGIVDMFGGDDYANQAKGLALTLGYLQSGANITPREAENIGRAYIPTAYDSDNVRQNKLSRAEQLLRNYLADTSSLTETQ